MTNLYHKQGCIEDRLVSIQVSIIGIIRPTTGYRDDDFDCSFNDVDDGHGGDTKKVIAASPPSTFTPIN